MDRTIRHITEQFVSKLPDGQDHYRIEDLKEYGFPAFLIQRILIELQWNLDESMILPKTDWADTQSEAVQQSWQQFLNAIHAEVHLPEPYARAVIETAVADIMEMLVQPRKNIPDILFGGEDVLAAQEVEERTELLVVYPHFARVITSYMNRKNKQELDRKQCKKVIEQVDEKVTRQYTPLQWAQMLDPLFALAGPEIDTDLLRLFFEDRNMNRTARKFDMMSDAISRASFIEILSSPEMLNYDGSEEDRSDLFSEEQAEEEKTVQQKEVDEMVEENNEADEPNDLPPKVEDEGVEEEGESFAAIEVEEDFAEKDQVESEEDEEEQLLQSMHAEQEEENEPESLVEHHISHEERTVEDEYEEKDNGTPLNAIFSSEAASKETYDEEPVTLDDEEEEKSAIWMRFMQSEEAEEEQEKTEEKSKNEQEPDHPENEYVNEPVIDLTDNDSADAQELERMLMDDKSYFVTELFDGSARAYDESLHEIAEKDTWEEASKLIEKNIFKRNMVDIYSEAAVDFTDRLQTYFLDKQNHN